MEPVQILLVNELGDKIHQGILWADHQAVVAELEARLQAASEREAIKDDALMEAVAILVTIHRPEAKEVVAICEAALSPDTKGA